MDVTAKGGFGWTALHLAARNGDLDPQVIRVLLEGGADVAARSDDEATPLHHAARHSAPEVVRILLERGADAAARDDNLKTPLHTAMTDGYSVPSDYSADPETVSLLLDYGADVNGEDEHGNTPLIYVSGGPSSRCSCTVTGPGCGRDGTERFRDNPLARGSRSRRLRDRSPAAGTGR